MAELYLFQDGNISHGFTPALIGRNFSGINYAATIITRTNISLTENFAKGSVSFKFARSHYYAKELLSNIPESPITVTVYRNDLPYWIGRVVSAKASGVVTTIECDSLYSTLARSGATARFTLNCRHMLYSANCGVVQNLNAYNFTANANSTAILISGMTQPIGFFNSGIAAMLGQQRRIIHQDTSYIYLTNPFTGNLTGAITLFPGCALTEAACTGYNNLPNFGGFSRTPQQDPFSSTGML